MSQSIAVSDKQQLEVTEIRDGLPSKYSTGGNAVLVLGTGSAYGHHYTTQQVLDALIQQQKIEGNDAFDVDFASRVLKGCGFKFHSIMLPLEDVFRRFTRSEYLHHRVTNLTSLAERAGVETLERWGGDRSEITHLFWGTMTGAMHSPTIDIELVRRLGLNRDVERTSIEGMGCLTGFRLMNLARQVVRGDPDAKILVIEADLRSALGNSLPKNPSRADIVSVCLFRDAASSAIIGCASKLNPQEDPCYEIVTGASRIVSETRHLVNYVEQDDGSICLHLDKKLPDHVALAEPEFVGDLLKKGKAALSKNGSLNQIPIGMEKIDVLCHTGGPRVLSEIGKSLGVPKKNMHSSWEVMTSHGNLSGASNMAVLDHHNQMAKKRTDETHEWAVCLSMGPGVCLEGILIRDVRKNRTVDVPKSVDELRKTIDVVGCGIAGATLAAALDPEKFRVRLFEASKEVREQGYGLAIWPSTMKILRDELRIEGLDLRKSSSMTLRSIDHKFETKAPTESQDKGFMKRSTLLKNIIAKVEEKHPGSIHTDHKALRVRLDSNRACTTYETSDINKPLVSHVSDLLVGADGVNSTVRRYVALKLDSRQYGSMTAYRFLVPSPSKYLLKETQDQWNMSVGETIHSPSYYVSNYDDSLNVVVLEYNGKPPSHPRSASLKELRDVAQRSNLSFVMDIIDSEEISDLMCYSTFHVDCEPWCQQNAVLIGDAAHAYGPLTAKMANLAINDAHSLAVLLNNNQDDHNLEQVLNEWQKIQRPKFDVTRIRTLRHLQLYMPTVRALASILWKLCPEFTMVYFKSIFAYDYEVQGRTPDSTTTAPTKEESKNSKNNLNGKCPGIVGVQDVDPLVALMKRCAGAIAWYYLLVLLLGPLALALVVVLALFSHHGMSFPYSTQTVKPSRKLRIQQPANFQHYPSWDSSSFCHPDQIHQEI